MPFSHLILRHNSGIKRFTAPRGFIYRITDVHVAIISAGANNNVVIVDRALEDVNGAIDFVTVKALLIYPAGITNAFDADFNVPIRTKYLTIGPSTISIAFIASITFNYELVSATQAELIWEWFGKKR